MEKLRPEIEEQLNETLREALFYEVEKLRRLHKVAVSAKRQAENCRCVTCKNIYQIRLAEFKAYYVEVYHYPPEDPNQE